MAQDIVLGQITELKEDGSVIIRAAVPRLDRAINRRYSKVLIAFQDGRSITPEQRKKAYALIGEIADWIGDSPESTKEAMKLEFRLSRMEGMAKKAFSLADVDMATATDFISYLIDFMVENGVPSSVPLYTLADDIGRYAYACLMNKVCCVCGEPNADLHHCTGSRIGMGGDRNKVHHLGRYVMALCRKHHSEIHTTSERAFWESYHLVPEKADKAICRKYRLKE